MTASKSERLLNLVILLLVSRSYVSKQRIRESVEDYAHSRTEDAFEKMFERDKEELRALGIPIDVGPVDSFFEDELGYRITRDSFELPELDLGPDEVAVLGLAARVWQHAGLAASTSTALLKLRAAGHDVDRDAIDSVRPTLPADDPAFDALFRATVDRRRVRFDYRRPGETSVTERHLEPWGVITAQHRWYVVGHDRDRDEPRMFRLSRIVGPVQGVGSRGAFEVPPGTDLQVLAKRLTRHSPSRLDAVVSARSGRAHGLRRRASRIDPEVRPGWDRVHISLSSTPGAVGQLLAYGDDVVVEAPAELRDEVRRRLEALVAAGAEEVGA